MHYLKPIKCIECDREFIRTNIGKKYCSDICKLLHNSTITPNGCREWKGFINHGYGRVRIKNRAYRAHRASYEIFKGEIPEGYLVCHRCDNTKCINPDHLFLGTQKENIRDMDEKNRRGNIKGELHPLHRLTEKDIMEIRKILGNGISQKQVARTYKIDQSHVSNIKNKKQWRHI